MQAQLSATGLISRLETLVKDWEQKSRRAFYDAELENDVMGRRLIEHGAMCRFNCSESLKEALKHDGQTTLAQEFWLVIDSDGASVYSASWEEACHEHINDAIDGNIEGAGLWKVRRAVMIE